MEAELFHADRQTDSQTDTLTNVIVVFRSFITSTDKHAPLNTNNAIQDNVLIKKKPLKIQ